MSELSLLVLAAIAIFYIYILALLHLVFNNCNTIIISLANPGCDNYLCLDVYLLIPIWSDTQLPPCWYRVNSRQNNMLPDGEIKALLPSVADVFGVPDKRANDLPPACWLMK
jgi:hypothetical protein